MRQSREVNIVVGNASITVLPSSSVRRAIVITTDTNPVYLSQLPAAVSGSGIHVPVNSQPLAICCKDAGEWLTFSLQAIAPAGNTNVCIIEVLADPLGDVEQNY